MSGIISRSDSLHERPLSLETSDLELATSVKAYAYITLLTRANYLAGVILLAHTLRKQGSRYPLIVLYTRTLEQAALRALELESARSYLTLKRVDLLVPGEQHKLNVAVERFNDTWTKLRVFEEYQHGYDTMCYLDADMLIFQDMDSVFDDAESLPSDSIAAVHDCVCSPDKSWFTPADFCPENCPLTAQRHPEALSHPMMVDSEDRRTYQLFNSGMFLYHPSSALWKEMLHFFNTTDLLGTFRFPDQDFLTHFFHGRWSSLSWKYNAVKTMAYRHQNLWRANEIVNLHYIVDKPWSRRISADGIAGFKGQDGESHRWWWESYEAWYDIRQAQGEHEVVAILSKHVARRQSESNDDQQPDMTAVGVDAAVHQPVAPAGMVEALSKLKLAESALDAASSLRF